MIRKPIQWQWKWALGAASVLLLLGAYEALSSWQHGRNPTDTTIPSLSSMWQGMVKASTVEPIDEDLLMDLDGDGEPDPVEQDPSWLYEDSIATGTRLGLGLLIGIAGALVLGLMMGCFAIVESFCYPPISLLAKVPPTAALGVFFAMVGTDMNMYVAMIAFGILPTLAQSVYLAVKDVPEELINKAYTLGASHAEVIWNVIVRHVLPRLIDGIRLQIGPAMVYLIAAEMLVADVGFGYRIRLQSRLLQMNVVYPYIILLAVFGFGVDYVLRKLQSFSAPWYGGAR